MAINKVGVLGCGLMGAGIAQVCAQAGFDTIVREIDQKFIDRGFGFIEKTLSRAVEKEKITAQQKEAAQERLHGTVELEDLNGCDLIGIVHRHKWVSSDLVTQAQLLQGHFHTAPYFSIGHKRDQRL